MQDMRRCDIVILFVKHTMNLVGLGKFMKHSYPIHAPRCLQKFQASHEQCDHCDRWIDNSDWGVSLQKRQPSLTVLAAAMHRTGCKAPPLHERRKKAARATAARARLEANGGTPTNIDDLPACGESLGPRTAFA